MNSITALNLGGDQRLLLRNGGDLGNLVGDRLVDGGSRERRVLGDVLGLLADGLGGRGGVGALATEHLLDLASVVTSILLGQRSDVLGLLLHNTLDLGGLSVDDVGGALEVLINQLLVRSIDKRNEKGHSGGNESKAPVRDELDEVVREVGGNTSLHYSVSAPNGTGIGSLTAVEAQMFSTKRIRWASITKKLMSSWTSPIAPSRVSRETV